MKWRLVVAIATVILLTTVTGWVIAQGVTPPQKPVRQTTFHIDGVDAPRTVDELWQLSMVVVEGAVIDERSANKRDLTVGGEMAETVMTVYTFQIERVLKTDSRTGPQATTIEVERYGGVVDRGAYVEERVERDFPKFKPQKRYLLFLRGRDVSAPYWLAGGPNGAFEIVGTTVLPMGKARGSQVLGTLDIDHVEALLAKQKGGV